MAGNTTVSQQQVDQTARSHDEARTNIESRLAKLAGDIGTHLPSSKSSLAQAVTTGYEDLQTEIKNKILQDLEQMATSMRRVAGQQADTDQSNSQAVTSAAGGGGSAVGSFLSGS